jgi:hypothetical protein
VKFKPNKINKISYKHYIVNKLYLFFLFNIQKTFLYLLNKQTNTNNMYDVNVFLENRSEISRAIEKLNFNFDSVGDYDFDSFEVGLADAVYGDPDLRIDLKSGKKIHWL